MNDFRLISRSEAETGRIAGIMAPSFRAGDVIILDGELGAGKTRFVQGLAAARGCTGSVTSPTFSIANFYKTTTVDILHVDLYRLETPAEFDDLGLTDYFPRAVVLVEWGLKFPGRVEASLVISFAREKRGDDARLLSVEAADTRGVTLLEETRSNLSSFIAC